jgi:hypothetical protein
VKYGKGKAKGALEKTIAPFEYAKYGDEKAKGTFEKTKGAFL